MADRWCVMAPFDGMLLAAIAVTVSAAADGCGAATMKPPSLESCAWRAALLCLGLGAGASPSDRDEQDDPGGKNTTSRLSPSSWSSSSSLLITIPIFPHTAVTTRRRRQRYLARSRRGATAATNSSGSDRVLAGTTTTATTTATSQLFEGYGTHYVDLWCGTPTPQRQTLIVDTGSAMTAFPCRFESETDGDGAKPWGCARPRNMNCGADGVHHVGTLYDAARSTTFAEVDCPDCLRESSCRADKRVRRDSGGAASRRRRRPCLVEQWYREGSGWEAREARDVCYLGSFHDDTRKPAAPFEATRSASHRKGESASIDGLDPAWAPWFAFPLQFACQTKVSGAFRTQLADGIMGMQPGASSSLWKQVLVQSESRHSRGGTISSAIKGWGTDDSRRQKQVDSQYSPWMKRGAFSLCFSSSPDIHKERLARRGLSAGLLTLGGADPRVSTETDMVYTRSGAPPGGKYFGVEIRHMYLVAAMSPRRTSDVLRLDVSESDLNRYQVIVDSGSTNTYLTSKAREPFERAWKELVGRHLDLSERFDSIESLPTVVFHLKGIWGLNRPMLRQVSRTGHPSLLVGATNNPLGSTVVDPDHPHDVLIALPPSQYCEWDIRRKSCRLSIDFDSHEDSALGASTLLNYHVLFDADENRLGWARSSCNYTAIVGGEFPVDQKATHPLKDFDVSQGKVSPGVVSEATSVRYDHDEVEGARMTDASATGPAESDSNATIDALSPTLAPSNHETPAVSIERQESRGRVSDAPPLNNAIVRSWWVVSGLTLVALFTMWRIRRRRMSAGSGGVRHEDRAPLLRKS